MNFFCLYFCLLQTTLKDMVARNASAYIMLLFECILSSLFIKFYLENPNPNFIYLRDFIVFILSNKIQQKFDTNDITSVTSKCFLTL